MDSFNEFLKNFSTKEITIKGKTYWEGTEGTHYRCTGLTKAVILWELKRAWASRYARTYKDDKRKWWVGEKGSRKGFNTEEAARKYQAKLITKYGAN